VASVADRSTWAPFEHVQCAYYSPRDGKVPFDGVGFVVSDSDNFTVFDFDKCRNPETGKIEPLIASYISRLDSYVEISPSLTGLRAIVEAKLPPKHRRNDHIHVEMYDNKRFVSLTGHVL
jgi:putative DNA primase/helicase